MWNGIKKTTNNKLIVQDSCMFQEFLRKTSIVLGNRSVIANCYFRDDVEILMSEIGTVEYNIFNKKATLKTKHFEKANDRKIHYNVFNDLATEGGFVIQFNNFRKLKNV